MTCHDPFPDGRFACELAVNHDGAHRDGRVAWSGGGSQVDDTNKADKGHG